MHLYMIYVGLYANNILAKYFILYLYTLYST